ncbi:selenium cofactor biosynthesis protein YqeC [Halanaerobaculum tunisiense]
MEQQLQKSLGIKQGDLVTVVGAGGKTATIIALVQEPIKQRLLVTTTTHFTEFDQFSNLEIMGEDTIQIINKLTDIWQKEAQQKVVVGRKLINYQATGVSYKIKGILPTEIDKLKLVFSDLNILVEGDGSAGKPIKAPASYEPVVPNETDILIPVLGMSGLGKEINDQYCHRLKQLTRLTDKNVIDKELIVKILTSVNSYGYYQNKVRNYIPILNQVEENNLAKIRKIAFELVEKGIKKVILANTRNFDPVLQVVRRGG